LIPQSCPCRDGNLAVCGIVVFLQFLSSTPVDTSKLIGHPWMSDLLASTTAQASKCYPSLSSVPSPSHHGRVEVTFQPYRWECCIFSQPDLCASKVQGLVHGPSLGISALDMPHAPYHSASLLTFPGLPTERMRRFHHPIGSSRPRRQDARLH